MRSGKKACIKFIHRTLWLVSGYANDNRYLPLKLCFRTCFRFFLGIIREIRICYKTEESTKKEAETYIESITLCF